MIVDDFNINCKKLYDEKYLNRFDYIFIFSNDISKYNIKDKYPTSMFVLGLKDVVFGDSMNFSIKYKANLTINFNDKIYVHDPLGNIFYVGTDIDAAFNIIIERLIFLQKITRKKTISSSNSNLKLNWFFDPYSIDMKAIDDNYDIPNVDAFLNVVKEYAKQYYDCIPSIHGDNQFKRQMRCRRGMPSFRYGENIIVSKRNVSNEFLTKEDLVATCLINNEIYYYGNEKPAVDTPIHFKLYDEFKNINFILHSHEYLKGAPFTKRMVPCGAIEEAFQISQVIHQNYNLDDELFVVNELGHGSIILAHQLQNIKGEVKKRQIPDTMALSFNF